MTSFAKPRSCRRTALLWLAAAALWTAPAPALFAAEGQASSAAPGVMPAAPAQAVGPSPGPTVVVPRVSPQPAPVDKPGFLNEIGRWWNGSVGLFTSTIKGAGGAFADFGKKSGTVAKDAAEVTQEGMKKTLDVGKDAATAIARLPNTRVVEMHATCQTAPNGAPDCAAAALSACRGRGFTGGRPLDVRTAERCELTQAWREGRTPAPGSCPIESWITRAVCQ